MPTPKKHLVNGEMLTIPNACKKHSKKITTIKSRMSRNDLSLEDALFNYKSTWLVGKGDKFGMLIATGLKSRNSKGQRTHECVCTCGNIVFVRGSALKAGVKKRCSQSKCTLKPTPIVEIYPKEYKAWAGMKHRCSNSKSELSIKNYQQRGIKVSKEFSDSFQVFLDHVGVCPNSSYSLDRINNNLGYQRGNLRWTDMSTQNSNKRTCKELQRSLDALSILLGNTKETPTKIKKQRRTGYKTKTKEYNAWQSAKSRCFNSKNAKFENYGGRGITMSIEFQKSFPDFLKHVGKCPDKSFSLDRIDPQGNYERGNLRWASQKTQQNNRRTVQGLEQTIKYLKKQCDEKGISYEGVI